ncbi:UDP-glucose 4-epimerase family protein [Pseudomonas sp. NPDC047961]
MRVLLTGASGFVGQAVLDRLVIDAGAGHQVVASYRCLPSAQREGVEYCLTPTLGPEADWHSALVGVDAVIHCAARVHVMDDASADPLAEFRRVNVDGTLALARQAVLAGVRRFIFLSSIKVNGEGTPLGQPYCVDDTPAPQDPYGISKLEAEQALLALAEETAMEVVIIRPVLVYGPGVKANFRSMMNWLCRGVPLPLGAISNKRSLVALDNLVDLIVTCVEHPKAANQIFLISDGEDLSTTELLHRMGLALGKPARLLPVPAALLEASALLFGKRATAQRLCGSLQVDISTTCERLGWTPPVRVDDALAKTAAYYLTHKA